MRRLVDRARLDRFFEAAGAAARQSTRIYVTGGASAVLEGWRQSTVDVDLRLVPEDDALLRALPALKELLEINVELVAPPDFIPELEGWETRSRFVVQAERATVYHYDFYAQCLAKLERAHELDLLDVREMLARGLVEPGALRRHFEAIEPHLYRYPAISPARFRANLDAALEPPRT